MIWTQTWKKGTSARQREPSRTAKKEEKSDFVAFDGPDDVENPKAKKDGPSLLLD
jgi:hypothetical protein